MKILNQSKLLKGRKPVIKGVIFGIITMVIYLLVVVFTTPALLPLDAINAAFQLNSIIIIGMGVGIGLQIYASEKSKNLGCKINNKKTFGKNTGSTAATSFFSFFSLIPLGCCGWWLYALSLLPGVFGVGATAILIEHNQVLAYVGLVIIYVFVIISFYKLRHAKTVLNKKE